MGAPVPHLNLYDAAGGRLTWVGGLYYSETNSERYFVRGSNTLGAYNGLASLPTTNGTAYSAYLSRAEAVNYAAFGQGEQGIDGHRQGVLGRVPHDVDVDVDVFAGRRIVGEQEEPAAGCASAALRLRSSGS